LHLQKIGEEWIADLSKLRKLEKYVNDKNFKHAFMRSKQVRVIVHLFTVVCLVTWPLSGGEAGVDLVLTQTLMLFICKYKLVSMRAT